MIKTYQKLPVCVQAVQWTGDNLDEIFKFADGVLHSTIHEDLILDTLEGLMTVSLNDYIIKGIEGEFYPCKPTIFEKTYREFIEG